MIDEFTYKETDYANMVVENGFITQYENYEMSLICKFWRETGLSKKDAKQNLIYFCEIYIPGYNEMKYYKKIDSTINKVYGKSGKLIQIDHIPIYRHEFDYISNLDFPHPYKRFLFAMLVLKKIHSEIWFINGGEKKLSAIMSGEKKQLQMVKEMAHLSGGKAERPEKMIFELKQAGIVNPLALAQIYLTFIDDIKEGISEEIVRVSDFTKVWMYYDYISGYTGGGKVILCGECNKPISVKAKSPQKYCETCAATKEKARKREYARQLKIKNSENI